MYTFKTIITKILKNSDEVYSNIDEIHQEHVIS